MAQAVKRKKEAARMTAFKLLQEYQKIKRVEPISKALQPYWSAIKKEPDIAKRKDMAYAAQLIDLAEKTKALVSPIAEFELKGKVPKKA